MTNLNQNCIKENNETKMDFVQKSEFCRKPLTILRNCQFFHCVGVSMDIDPISNPLLFIDSKIFKNELFSFDVDIENEFETIIKNHYNSIPYMNKRNMKNGIIKHNSLVRYRCLVQDILDPEFFVGICSETCVKSDQTRQRLTLFRDINVIDPDVRVEFVELNNDVSTIMERVPYFCVPIPGECDWVKEFCGVLHQPTNPSVNEELKRRKISHEKRSTLEHEDAVMDTGHVDNGLDAIAPADCLGEVQRYTGRQFHSGGGEVCCLVKMYHLPSRQSGSKEHCDKPSVRLGDMLEVVGVFSEEGEEGEVDGGGDGVNGEEVDGGGEGGRQWDSLLVDDEALLATIGNCKWGRKGLIPRIHCVSHRIITGDSHLHLACMSLPRGDSDSHSQAQDTPPPSSKRALSKHELNPEVDFSSASPFSYTSHLHRDLDCPTVYRDVVSSLSEALYGDSLAAEYVALCLLSRVSGSRDAALLLGSLTVNLCHSDVNNLSKQRLHTVLRQIVPRMAEVQFDLTTLHDYPFLPSKDCDSNRMVPSPLQLGQGTVLVLDERRMSEGKMMSNSAVAGVVAVKSVVNKQQLPVQFEYYQLLLQTDFPVIIHSASRSVLSSGDNNVISLPLCHDIEAASKCPSDSSSTCMDVEGRDEGQHTHGGGAERLDHFDPVVHRDARCWWMGQRQCRHDISMTDEVLEMAEYDFVQARQIDPSVTMQNMHMWLVMSRLLAQALGASTITPDMWSHVRDMENNRKLRLSLIR